MNPCLCFLLIFVGFYVPNSIAGMKKHDQLAGKEGKETADLLSSVAKVLASSDEELLDFSFPHHFGPSSSSSSQSEQTVEQIAHHFSSHNNLLPNLQKQNANEKGTLETFYKGIETAWEIYRQRDNSGKYIKFRMVDKKNNHQTMGQWIMPVPKKEITLFFNNNRSVPFQFDQKGKIIEKGQNGSEDQIASTGRTFYEYMKMGKLSKHEIDQLIANSAPPAPIYTQNAIPKETLPKNIYDWHKMPLPLSHLLKFDEKIKVSETDNVGTEEGKPKFDQIKEQLDDGQNWVQIKVRQGESRAEFVRNLFGDPPNLRERVPLTLFFDGAKRHFDWNGTAMSDTAFHFWRKKEEEKAMPKMPEERANDK